MARFRYRLASGAGSLWRATGLAVVIALQCLPGASASAETLKGVALVVGQSDYSSLPDLANTGRDAEAIESLLDDLGFDATVTSDRDARRLARDLDGLLDDAEGADVALVYYAGHAVEIGGENFLVPVDADGSAPEALAGSLRNLTEYVAELRKRAKVTIVILDACRDNPFPPGTLVPTGPSASPDAVAETSVGARGAARLSAPTSSADGSLGLVIAFAAEPGKVALDGDPGGNSPYAAAILRHLSAMSGAEFGTVMRLVAEEVYLKTGGRQRPWTNESLRRLLYFGDAATELSGDEGDILKERRQLLLTIAALPDFERGQVERVAAHGGVPMDAVYGMLTALGSAAPEDPAKLEEVLRSETERFAKVLAEREAVVSPDPEILRLTALADNAEREGLVSSANSLRERAKARFRELVPTLEAQQAALDQRFVEGAAVFARSAQTKALAFDHLGAAEDYAEAFELVENRDDRLAWAYKDAELVALSEHGDERGDKATLQRAIVAGQQALAIAERLGESSNWASTKTSIGMALFIVGQRENSSVNLERAVLAFREAIDKLSRESSPIAWAFIQDNLGAALLRLGERSSDTVLIGEAVSAHRSALLELERESEPTRWADAQNRLGVAIHTLAYRTGRSDQMEAAVAAYRAALEAYTREDAPLQWAQTHSNLGAALKTLGDWSGNTEQMEAAVDSFHAALQERTRDRVPIQWAATQINLGNVLRTLGQRLNDPGKLEESVTFYRSALQELTMDRAPQEWALAQNNLGVTLSTLALFESGTAKLEESVAALRAALLVRTRDRVALDWAITQTDLGNALSILGERQADPATLKEAVLAFNSALEEMTRKRMPLEWARLQNSLGATLLVLAKQESGTSSLEKSVAAYRSALFEKNRELAPQDWMILQFSLADALKLLGERQTGIEKLKAAVPAFKAGLEELSRDEWPYVWASLQYKLGETLFLIGRRTGDVDWYQDASAAYEASLEELSREKTPSEWGRTQLSLAQTYLQIGHLLEINDKIRHWKNALSAWNNAYETGSREKNPDLWAQTQSGIGQAIVFIGEYDDDLGPSLKAAEVFREALDPQRPTGSALAYQTAHSLCRALRQIGARKRDRAVLLEAKALCEAAFAGMSALGDVTAPEAADNLMRVEAALLALD